MEASGFTEAWEYAASIRVRVLRRDARRGPMNTVNETALRRGV